VTINIVNDVAPAVSITAPSSGANIVSGTNVPVAITATSQYSTVSNVQLYLVSAQGTSLLKKLMTAPYTYTWSKPALGSYSLYAVATDTQGLATTSALVPVTIVADVAPTVSITSPADSTVYDPNPTVALAAAASSEYSTISEVDFYQGSTLLKKDTTPPYAYNWSKPTAGTYTLTAVATDAAGLSTTSTPVSVTVVADVAPTVSITSPADGTVYDPNPTVALAATASSEYSTISEVDFYQGSTLLKKVTRSPYTYSWSKPAAGTYTLTAVATDALGLSTTSTPASITVNP
jgi:hypothetical protein